MSESENTWAAQALEQFDALVHADAGFRPREGQRRMADLVAQTFADADLAKDSAAPAAAPARAIAVIEAGTGVGKSLAYSIPAISVALARGTRVVISTATVALQEQLVDKDLPALAARMPEPFVFALAKGRGRYVCKLKLERQASGGDGAEAEEEAAPDDLFADQAPARAPGKARSAPERQAFYTQLADALARQQWTGDRDALPSAPDPQWWAPIAAEASGCTSRHCPLFHQCSYFEQRKSLVQAQVIVANHDLLLSSLGARLLPDLDNCLWIFDEAHHLPQTALSQFAAEMNLSGLSWITQLTGRALRVGQHVEVSEIAHIPEHALRLRQALQDFARLVLDFYGEALRAPGPGRPPLAAGAPPMRVRVAQGQWPEALNAPLGQIVHHGGGFIEALRAIAKALRTQMRDQPQESRTLAQLYAQVGALAPRLEQVYACAQSLLQDSDADAPPVAKWFTLAVEGPWLTLRAHASAVQPGSALKTRLWAPMRAAVLTSATLTSCGQFDFFLREVGLYGDSDLQTAQVASPFDYPNQGTLVAVSTPAEPRDAALFTAQMCQALVQDIAQVQAGALVLFTSRDQMRQAVEALPDSLRARVLVQNQWPRQQLLAQHRQRVADGQASIIFGMQSFGEGLDLPGALCESLFITKLPFAPPDDPVGETRAQWLRAAGRDPFTELVVPATAMRLAQWVGRAIRTEEDRAHVYCYDKRLVTTGYGQRLLSGLPAFALQRRSM